MARVYVGNLPADIKESELDDLFYKYGRIRNIDIKTPARPPAFAFVTYDDSRDAEDAVRGRDGYSFDGRRLRCEFAKGDRRDRDRDDRRGRDDRRRPERRRSDFAVQITNLPRGCSWQDLKDLMRKIGDVTFADVDKHGEGTVEFSNREDMEKAIKDLDDTEFKSFNDTSFIRVKAFKAASEERRSRSRSKDRKEPSRSRSRDRRSRSRSHSRSSSAPRDSGRDRERDDN